MAKHALVGVCLVVSFHLGAGAAEAQLARATGPVATPASSTVLQDDALALDLNPAALGLLPSWSLALLHAEVDRAGSWLGRGDAFYLGTPVIGPLALGLTLQSIRPGDRALRPLSDSDGDRALIGFGLAVAPSEGVSIGIASRTFTSSGDAFDALSSIDAGLAMRPSRFFNVSLTGRDLFISREGFGTEGLGLGTSGLLSIGLRPFGTEALTLEVAVAGRPSDLDQLGGRAGAVIEIPYVGAISGLIESERLADADQALRFVAELALTAGQVTGAGGATFGDGFGDDAGWYAMVRADGRERTGIPSAVRVLDLELGGASPRSMVGVSLALERAQFDSRIGGVLLRPRGGGMPLAYAQELRLQIAALRAAGKPVVCHLESAAGSDYYACAAADRTFIDPAGDVRLMGTASTVMLFGDTLRKIGVRADFIRIGAQKSAPEQYTQSTMSDEAREQTRGILDEAHRRVLFDLARDLEISESQVADLIDGGPYLARSAVSKKLLDGVADRSELDDDDLSVFGGRRPTRSLPESHSRAWGRARGVGVIVIDEQIVDGENVDVPFIDIHMTGGDTIVRELESMAADPMIGAIVLRVDSPGGAALASDRIWRAVRRARKSKPVVASMGAVAASGGYYVACAADEIWADPSTLTGSIGIFYGKVDVAGLAEMLGVGLESFGRGKHAGAESLFRPFTDEERAALADVMRTYYRLFLSRVAEGRAMSVEAVDVLGRGRVYSGDAAQGVGLVDRLGGFTSALLRARALAGVSADAPVAVRPLRRDGLLDYVLGGGLSVQTEDATVEASATGSLLELPAAARPLVRAALTLHLLGDGAPLALLPYQLEL
jgi:protease-4